MTSDSKENYEEVKTRLDQIVDEVADENISLDAALDLYEEAIKLGMQVSSLLEEDIAAEEVQAAVEALDVTDEEGGSEGDEAVSQESGESAPESSGGEEADHE